MEVRIQSPNLSTSKIVYRHTPTPSPSPLSARHKAWSSVNRSSSFNNVFTRYQRKKTAIAKLKSFTTRNTTKMRWTSRQIKSKDHSKSKRIFHQIKTSRSLQPPINRPNDYSKNQTPTVIRTWRQRTPNKFNLLTIPQTTPTTCPT